MDIKLDIKKLETETRDKLGISAYSGFVTLDLANLSTETIQHISKTLTPLKSVRGVQLALRTIDAYNKLVKLAPDETCAKAKKIEQYYLGMRRILAALPGKRLYVLGEDGYTTRADGYYIEKMDMSPRRRERDRDGHWYWIDGLISLVLTHLNDRGLQRKEVHFNEFKCYGKHPFVMLKDHDYLVETPELKIEMLATRTRWYETHQTIGMQLNAIGTANAEKKKGDDDDEERRRFWYQNEEKTVKLDRDGPAQLVVDVDNEADDSNEDEDGDKSISTFGINFWETEGKLSDHESNLLKAIEEAKPVKKKAAAEDDESDDDVFDEDEDDENEESDVVVEGNGMVKGTIERIGPISEVPVHPWITAFDLRKHHRVRLHMSQTKPYVYDVTMRNKLVIDLNSRMLIEMLLHQREQFKDIVAKKGGGAVILCAGPPGVGKTLTSEIFAESEKRPLYSVQCSQLGTSADELESSLLMIFARAQRWKAILLLDEADVYIAKRGNDMNQNAIVGVFLRVLEYYNGVMFMTTNRAESVDDAVLSRCVARIDYANPSREDQVKIWHILATSSGLAIKAGAAEEIAAKYSLSGRDVKQILKLAGLVAYARKMTEIDVAVVEFCMRFKPTERIVDSKK